VKMMWSPQERAAKIQDRAKSFEGWFVSNGNGMFANVTNKEHIGRLIVTHAENLYRASGGALSQEKALELAEQRVKASYAYDGHNSMVQIPANIGKDAAMERLKPWIAEVKGQYSTANYGLPLENYQVVLQQQNGQPTWTVVDHLGRTVSSTVTWESLNQQWLKQNNATFGQAVSAAQDSRRTDYSEYASGKIDAIEYDKRRMERYRAQQASWQAKADEQMGRLAAAPKLPPPDLAGVNLRIRVPQPKGPEMNTKEMGLRFVNSNPDFALTVVGEGFRNTVYRDTGGTRALGLAYNIDARGGDEVAKKDFARIGITDPERVQRILGGKEAITAEEGVRLYEVIKKEYSTRAQSLVGGATWGALRPHQQAVLTDLAYQTGKGTFTKVWDKLKAGDAQGATDVLAAAMKERGAGAKRRMALRLAMWESPDRFRQLVEQGI
jgi:GH24 family phage-related lysozyme (muramidase)